MQITIDGRTIEALPTDKNIVEAADRAKIGIPAPCYRTSQNKGCCRGCVIEIDGEQKFACCTAPKEGMNIILNRPDLKALRADRLKAYAKAGPNANPCTCGCSCTTNNNCC